MAITQDSILGRNCTLSLTTATFSGTVVNWDNFDAGMEKVQSDFITATSTVTGFVNTRESVPPFTIRLKRGLNTTFADLVKMFDDESVTAFAMTDWPTHSVMIAKFGPLSVVRINMGQGESFGTADVTLRYGKKTAGYTVAT